MSNGVSPTCYDDRGSQTLDHAGSSEFSPDDTKLPLEASDDLFPFVGQRFLSHDEAYEFYRDFAKRSGFSIRRHRTEGKNGIGKGLTRRYFVCHRAGNTPSRPPHGSKPRRNRKSSRCGCQAYLRVSKTADPEEWRVTGFSNDHNHDLLRLHQVRFLPAYRSIPEADKNRIVIFARSGISVSQMMRVMELEKSLSPGELPFTEKDVRNFIQSLRRSEHKNEERADLLQICKSNSLKNPDFKYEFTLDAIGNIENIAWSNGSSLSQYETFGDAILFDTTHRSSIFNMAMGLWIGMSNYGSPCLFGCVLLREENVESFSWAIKVFLRFTNGRAPRTILTDQDDCLEEAIKKEMAHPKHALCIWLLAAKFPSRFNTLLGERYGDWKAEIYRLYEAETVNDFETGWIEMVNSFGLHTNRHVASLYALRELWALPYMRDHFFAGFTFQGVSKSMNSFVHRCLPLSIDQASVALEFKDQATEQQIMRQNLENISLKTGFPLESHAASVLTPYAFFKLQDELVNAAHYSPFQGEEGAFVVRRHDDARKVVLDPQEQGLSCDCCMFERTGILCRHALLVLLTVNCLQIPDKYLPPRWRRVNSVLHQDTCVDQVQNLRSMINAIVAEAEKSKERLDIASEEISALLSRLREQPAPST